MQESNATSVAICEIEYKSGAGVRVVCKDVSKCAKQRQEVEVEVKGQGCYTNQQPAQPSACPSVTLPSTNRGGATNSVPSCTCPKPSVCGAYVDPPRIAAAGARC